MEQGQQFIFSFAVGEEQAEEDAEIAGSDQDIFGDLFSDVGGIFGMSGYILDGGTASEWHQLELLLILTVE